MDKIGDKYSRNTEGRVFVLVYLYSSQYCYRTSKWSLDLLTFRLELADITSGCREETDPTVSPRREIYFVFSRLSLKNVLSAQLSLSRLFSQFGVIGHLDDD